MKIVIVALLVLLYAPDAYAIQQHPGIEGYFVHQFAHVIFAASMAFVMVVLKRPLTARIAGWRLVRYSALCFLLWNADTFLGHIASRRVEAAEGYIRGSDIYLKDVSSYTYYVTGMTEYVFLVAAFLLLAMGLDRLYKHLKAEDAR